MITPDKKQISLDESQWKDNAYYQSNPKMFMELIALLVKHPTSYGMKFKHLTSLKPLKQWIDNVLPLLTDSIYTMSTKICWLINGYQDFPKCIICGKKIGIRKNVSSKRGYSLYCCIKCRCNDPNLIQQQITTLKSHAVNDPEYFKKLEQKKKNTKIKHGHSPNWVNAEKAKETIAKNPNHWKDRQEKTRQTNLERYGNPVYVNSDAIAKTMLEHYGVTSYTKTDAYKIKTKQTSQKRYGFDSPNQSPIVKQHKKDGSFKKYGVDHPMKSDIVKAHLIESVFKKHGVYWTSQIPGIRHKSKHQYCFNAMIFDSIPELAFYIWLKDHKIDFSYKPNISLDYQFDGKIWKYFPDFIVKGRFYEIKGDQFFNKDGIMYCPWRNHNCSDEQYDWLCKKYAAKQECMNANNVKVIKSSLCHHFISYVNNVYGKHFLKSCKIS